ncbi:hypothetical protein [Rhodanobacter umsongensis]
MDSTVSRSEIGQRFPEQDAAVAAIVVERIQAIEENHHEQYDADQHHRCQDADVECLADRIQGIGAHVCGDRVEVDAVDMHSATRAEHLAGDDAHQGQQKDDAAGDDRCPYEASAMLPELALDQPVEGFHA